MAAVTSQSASTSTSSCDLACLAIFDPVCASNGETFSNACEFNQTRCASGNDMLEIVAQGACSSASASASSSGSGNGASCLQEFACLDVYGSDGQTYSNECFLRRAQCSDPTLVMTSSGECAAISSSASDGSAGSGGCVDSVCTEEFLPQCGSDGVTGMHHSAASISGPGPEVGSESALGSGPASFSETNAASSSRKSATLVAALIALLAMLAL